MAEGEGDEIAEVFITIRPRTTGFKQEAEAELEKNRPEVKADVTPKLDKSKLATLKAELDAFGKDVENIKIDLNDKQALAKLAKFKAEYSGLVKGLTGTARLDLAGQDKVLAQIAAARAAVDAYGHKRETAHLDLDTSNFDRNVEKAKGGVEKIRKGLDDLKGGIDKLTVDVADKKAFAELKAIQAEFAKLSHASATAKLSVTGEAEGEAKVAALAARVDAFGRKHATATVDINSKGAEQGGQQAVGIFNKLIAIAGAVAPALVPIGATILGVSGQIVTSLSAAGAGLGAFGIAVAGSVKLIQSDMKALAKLNANVVTAQNAVDNAKTPTARAAAMKRLTEATQKYNTALKALGPAEQEVIKDFDAAKNKFAAWDRAIGLPAIAKVAHAGLPLFNDLLKIMTPLVRAAADALVILENRADKSLHGAFGEKFIAFLTGHAKNDILVWARALANIGKGFAGILLAFAPFDKKFGSGLDGLTKKFADWGANLGSSKGFKSFFAYFQKSGPVVGKLLGAMATAFSDVSRALKGIGLLELKLFTGDLVSIANLAEKNPAILQIGLALLAVAKGMKAIKLLALAAVLSPLLKFAEAHPTFTKVALAIFLVAKAVAALKTASLGLSLAKLGASIAGAGAGAAGSAAGAAGGAAAGAGEGAAAGGIIARLPALVAGAGGAGVVALLLAPIAAGIFASLTSKNRPPLKGPGSLKPNGDPTIPGPIGTAQIDANNGGTFDPGQKGNKNPQTFSAPPVIKVGSEFNAPPILGPNSGLKKKGRGYELEGQIAIHAGLDDSFSKAGKKGKDDFNAAFFGNEGNSKPKVPKSGLPNSGTPLIPPGGGVDSTAATKAINAVKKALGELPKGRTISITAPASKNTAQAIDNIYLAQKGLKGSVRIAVSAPGANLSLIDLINVGRAAKGLKPIASVKTSAPGAKGAREDINTLAHQAGLLPKSKNVSTSARGAKGAILDLINLDREAHGLKPVASIKAAVPGADAAVRKLITLGQKAGILPKDKNINVDAPGAQNAINHINTLMQRAGLLPKGKSIPTDVPGAQKSILQYIQLYEKAHHLPVSKTIPTTAPHADKSIQQMIDLARKIGLVPKSHDTKTSTSGAAAANKAIQTLIDTLGRLSNKDYEFTVKGSGSWSATDLPPLTGDGGIGHGPGGAPGHAFGGQVRGSGGPRQDNIPIWASAGEWMQPADAVQHYGTGAMEAVRTKKAVIIPNYASGGLVGHFDKPAGLGNIAKQAESIIPRGEGAMAGAFKKQVQKFLSSLPTGGGGGAGQWMGVIAEALALLHQPIGLAGLFDRVIAGESGGNPSAINLSDSNAKAGHPSVGLAQVIRGTFDAFAGPFRNVGPFLAGVSVNPLANIYSGLNYGIQTYGSVAGIPGIASELHGGGYRPYAEGGLIEGLHSGGPVQGVKKGGRGEWVKALAIQARQLRGAFHQGTFSGALANELNADWPNKEPHHLPKLAKFDPTVKRLVAYLWGRHGKKTTMDDALGHFNHGQNPMAFLDIQRAYDAGKSYILEFKGKGKARHRFIPDSTTVPFRAGLRRYEHEYHHDVQALEHKLKFKPENGEWGAGLDGAVKHAIAHALGKKHDAFLPRPWSPLTPVEKALQSALTANKQSAEFRKDQDQFGKWNLVDLVQTLAGEDIATALPIARSAAKNRAMATKLNAAYRVADTSTLGGHFVNQGFLGSGKGYAHFASGGRPRPGWAWAGENGPELVKFRGTEQVYPARESAQMVGASHGSSRDAPLIGHATFTDNTSVELQLRRAAFIEQQVR